MNLDPVILAELMRGGPPLWVSGRTYPVGFVVRSPGNLQSYVRVAAGAGNADLRGAMRTGCCRRRASRMPWQRSVIRCRPAARKRDGGETM